MNRKWKVIDNNFRISGVTGAMTRQYDNLTDYALIMVSFASVAGNAPSSVILSTPMAANFGPPAQSNLFNVAVPAAGQLTWAFLGEDRVTPLPPTLVIGANMAAGGDVVNITVEGQLMANYGAGYDPRIDKDQR